MQAKKDLENLLDIINETQVFLVSNFEDISEQIVIRLDQFIKDKLDKENCNPNFQISDLFRETYRSKKATLLTFKSQLVSFEKAYTEEERKILKQI